MKRILQLVIVLAVAFTAVPNHFAQIRPVYDRGVMGLAQAMKRVNTSATVMMIGAHPDDEDTALLAFLARGMAARTAYLSLTRGDGGQNILGGELGDGLGVIRTEELLQARKLDGAEQYFTRAYDYGFSKTLEEAKSKWNEELILCDVVRVIREFRPLVVVSRFSGTPSDGHGQHQFAGYIAQPAIEAAADPAKCSSAGPAWRVRKFYRSQGFRSTGDPRLSINTGVYDKMLGRSYFEVAMEARSQHRSQEQGVLELKGPMFSGVNLVGSDVKEVSIFDGLDTFVSAIASHTRNSEPAFIEVLRKLEGKAAEAKRLFEQNDERLVSALAEGYKLAYDAEWSTRLPNSKAFMRQKQREFAEAIKLAAGLQIDAISDSETVISGGTNKVAARIFYPASSIVSVEEIKLKTPVGWSVETAEGPSGPQTGFFRRESPNKEAHFIVTAAANAARTEPYWLREPRKDGIFTPAPNDPNMIRPVADASVFAEVTAMIAGVRVVFEQPVEYRFAHDTRGEIRRPLVVVPKVSVKLDRSIMAVPVSAVKRIVAFNAEVTNNADSLVAGTLELELPNGWKANSSDAKFSLPKRGQKHSLVFNVEIPAGTASGENDVRAFAIVDGERFDSAMEIIEYPHIQTHRLYRDAVTRVNIFDIKTTDVKIGYLPGSGDKTAESMAAIGFDVATITDEEFAGGDLSKYDVIIVGIRASEVRSDLAANNARLIDFAQNGGTLVVQYQRPVYVRGGFTPFPAEMAARTADETAPVTILRPEHPIFNFPNKISAADFEGWVQERNLYNFTTMDERYTGLLETHDPGEAENAGGLVIAQVGSGHYIYCSFSMFRQLPAGVSGAYRLFANIVSFPRAKK